MHEHHALIDLLVTQMDALQDPHGSNLLLALPLRKTRRRIRHRFKQTLMSGQCKRCKGRQMLRARCDSGPLVHLASYASRARLANPVFSVLRVSKALPMQRGSHSSLTIVRPVSMAIIQPVLELLIQRPRRPVQTTSLPTNAAHVAIVEVVADVTRVPGPTTATARAKRAYRTTPTLPSRPAKPTSTQHSRASMANIRPPRRASPTGCLMIPAMAHRGQIQALSVTQVVRWIARRDAIEITVKSAPAARHPFASAKARATA